MTILMWVGLYVLGVVGFIVYESLVGFGDLDFDGEDLPPAWLLGIFWMISLPILMLCSLSDKLKSAKQRRLERVEERKRAEQEKIRLVRKIRVEHEEAVRKAELELEAEENKSYKRM